VPPYKSSTRALPEKIKKMLRASDKHDGTLVPRTEAVLKEDASQTSHDALKKLTQARDPARLLWLALYGLDIELDERDRRHEVLSFTEATDLINSLLSSKQSVRRTLIDALNRRPEKLPGSPSFLDFWIEREDIRSSLRIGQAARQREQIDGWSELIGKLLDLAGVVNRLSEIRTWLMLPDSRMCLLEELADMLMEFTERAINVAPARGRGAPRHSDNNPMQQRTAVVMFLLHRDGMKPFDLHALVKHSVRDWSPQPPIRPRRVREMLREKRSLRDRISLLIKEGRRLVEATRAK